MLSGFGLRDLGLPGLAQGKHVGKQLGACMKHASRGEAETPALPCKRMQPSLLLPACGSSGQLTRLPRAHF